MKLWTVYLKNVIWIWNS